MTTEEVNFEPTATPNFPMAQGRWAMIWMDALNEVPAQAHAYQVPLFRWTEGELQDKIAEVEALSQAAHPGCPDLKVVVSRGTGQWEGMAAIHSEGSL